MKLRVLRFGSHENSPQIPAIAQQSP